MLKTGVLAVLLAASALVVPLSAQAAPAVPESLPAASNIVPVQGYWERCRYLRERIREIEDSPLLRAAL